MVCFRIGIANAQGCPSVRTRRLASRVLSAPGALDAKRSGGRAQVRVATRVVDTRVVDERGQRSDDGTNCLRPLRTRHERAPLGTGALLVGCRVVTVGRSRPGLPGP